MNKYDYSYRLSEKKNMKIFCQFIFLILIVNIVLAGCAAHSMLTIPDANVRSSLEEISKYDNDKAKIVKKLP